MSDHCEGNCHVSIAPGVCYCPRNKCLFLDPEKVVPEMSWVAPRYMRIPFVRDTVLESFRYAFPGKECNFVADVLHGEEIKGLDMDCPTPEQLGW